MTQRYSEWTEEAQVAYSLSGLGLIVDKDPFDMHSEELWASSKKGGPTHTYYMPGHERRPGKLAYVEDNPGLRESLQGLADELGLEFSYAISLKNCPDRMLSFVRGGVTHIIPKGNRHFPHDIMMDDVR